MRRVLLCALLVSGCSPLRLVPPETDTAARAALDSLRADTVHLVAATRFRSFRRDFQQWTLDYQLHNQKGWAAARVVVAASGGKRAVGDLFVMPLSDSLVTLNALTWHNASRAGLLALFTGLNLAAFCIITAVLILRTPMPWRWAYALGSFIGIGALRVPWSPGFVSVQEAAINLSVRLTHATRFSPWVISLALPLGAIVALERRWRFLHPTTATAVTIPLGVRVVIGLIEIASGAWAIWMGLGDPVVILVGLAAVVGGGLLCAGRRAGVLISRVVQAMQVVRIYTGVFAFGVVMGPEATVVWNNAGWNFVADGSLRFDFVASSTHGIEINLVAVLFLAWLLTTWKNYGDARGLQSAAAPR